MVTLYYTLLVVAILVALLFSTLVFLTGKGDAMSGGGAIRTSYKGKASFDDLMSRITLGLGIAFLVLMIVIDAVSNGVTFS